MSSKHVEGDHSTVLFIFSELRKSVRVREAGSYIPYELYSTFKCPKYFFLMCKVTCLASERQRCIRR